MRTLRRWPLLLLLCATAGSANAGEITLHFGTYSAGNGGNNPVSIPPTNPLEYELEYITDKGFVTNIGLIPGILFGGRSKIPSGVYVDLGGGLVIDANGSGPGAYSALGYNYGDGIAFNVEFKQAIGYDFSADSALSPHSLRIGATFSF